MAMMTGRVLLVCALCVLWCGAAVLVSAAGDVVDGDGRGVRGESLPEGAQHAVLLPSSPDSSVALKEGTSPLQKRVEKVPALAKQSSEEDNEAGDQVVEDVTVPIEGQQQRQENAQEMYGVETPGVLIIKKEAPQAREGERNLTAAPMEGSPTTPGPQAPKPKLQPPPTPAILRPEAGEERPSPPQASGVGEADGGPVGIEGTGRNVSGGGSLVGASDASRVTGEATKDPKGSEGPVSGPPSGGASSSPISNDGDASRKNGGAPSTQDTTSLKNNEQSRPTTSSGNAPLNRETPERSTPDAKQHSSETQENETSRLPDGDANYSAAGQSAVGTKGSSGVSTTASNAPTTPLPQLPAPPVPTVSTVTGAPAEKPTAEQSPPPADSTTGEGLAATTTAQTNDTATPGDSDGSTAVSHTTSPLLLLVFACAAAAAVVAA
ncbi:Mucin-associated surface protein (MASP) [Trypanosoma cruzi]|uniref:Mucin-associated surface protein (MASP), putative n=2 Tax=Trypanosoma cruzi TaxID=5693 RepID=Q4D9A1_TRYCC|nr:mucin-associated surface protein (MASP), putative [Trypanosoma cruzi]EAN89104.1 mucin-associated surface protein (MASP), putative [Trypanosoma cruzi]PWV12291.1 Mucin-associated surface protein (MASP) [Trypanosoma cruzi]|eukprot:XP_810955.1 mucin-associated surface protein (MASP) [Trypanosoma cruzi strain CL Brener]